MPALVDDLPIDVYQGEDWTAQLVIIDQNGDSPNLVTPIQLDVKDAVGQIVLSLITSGDAVPEISYSSDIGLIQLHIDRSTSAAISPGVYVYDLFASAHDAAYAQDQRFVVARGMFTVTKRITVMT